jgi:LL-diaminopimelate aminotransferase
MTISTLLADRLQNIPPYPFAAVAAEVRQLRSQGIDVIQLDIGSPDMPPPPHVIEKLCVSAQNPNQHGYGGFAGTPELRSAFASYYHRRFGVLLDPECEVLPLLGSKEGIVNIHLAMINPGDVVLVPDPGYIAYSRGAILAGGEPYLMPLLPENRFLPDLSAIPQHILRRARIMWINYPNNPTGALATLDDYIQIVRFCREHNLLLCSDNPYADVTFDNAYAPSILEVDGAKDIAVEFNSVSKTFNMAGWRIGFCAGNRMMVQTLLRIKSNIDSGLFNVLQDAACAAFTETTRSWIDQRNETYRKRRDLVMSFLDRIGLSANAPEGSLYIWAAVRGGDDAGYVKGALKEAHVSLSPGSFYGPTGNGYIRMSLVVSGERILEAMERLVVWHNE